MKKLRREEGGPGEAGTTSTGPVVKDVQPEHLTWGAHLYSETGVEGTAWDQVSMICL